MNEKIYIGVKALQAQQNRLRGLGRDMANEAEKILQNIFEEFKAGRNERASELVSTRNNLRDWGERVAKEAEELRRLIADAPRAVETGASKESDVEFAREPAVSADIKGNVVSGSSSFIVIDPKEPSAKFKVAGTYYRQLNYEKALELYEKALRQQIELNGEGGEDAARIHNAIGMVLFTLARYDEAIEHFNYGIGVFGDEDNEDAAALFNNIAVTFIEKGEYDSAARWCERSMAVMEGIHGKNHAYTATTYHARARIYSFVADYDKALGFYGKALAIRETVLGEDHPDTAATYNNMANVYAVQGDCDKALEFYGKTLAINEAIFGKEHPNTTATYNNMGLVYDDKGDYDKALAIRETVHGKNHPDTAMTYNNMGLVYADKADYDKALEFYGKALATFEAVLGEDHPYTVSTRRNIESVTRVQNKSGNLQRFPTPMYNEESSRPLSELNADDEEIPISDTNRFHGKRPAAVKIGGSVIQATTWKRVAETVIQEKCKREKAFDRLLELRGKVWGRHRLILSDKSTDMRAPMLLYKDTWFESHDPTVSMMDNVLHKILDKINVRYDDVFVMLRREEA